MPKNLKKKKDLQTFLTGFDYQLNSQTAKFADKHQMWEPEALAEQFELPKMNTVAKSDPLAELIRGELVGIEDTEQTPAKKKFEELFAENLNLAAEIGFDKEKLMAD